MKRNILPLSVLLFCLMVTGVQAQGFSIKALLGTFTTGESQDNWRETLNYLVVDARKSGGSSSGLDTSMEFALYLTEDLYLSLGVGYMNKEILGGEAVFSYPESSGFRGGFSSRAQMSLTLYPVTANLGHHFWISEYFRLVVFGGAGYYFGSLNTLDDQLSREPTTSDNIPYGYFPTYYSSDLSGIGLHGAISFDIVLSQSTTFVMEALYRHLVFEDPSTQQSMFKTEFDPGEGDGAVFMHYKLLSGDGPGNIIYRMSELNISGFQIRSGIRFRF